MIAFKICSPTLHNIASLSEDMVLVFHAVLPVLVHAILHMTILKVIRRDECSPAKREMGRQDGPSPDAVAPSRRLSQTM